MSPTLEALSQPISAELPSGDNLEYDPQYMKMETLFQSRGESSIAGFEEGVAGPDWKGVEQLAAELLERTRDLRVQVYATLASIHTQGLFAFRDNLKALQVFLDDFWETVHPQLDPSDNNDPTLRSNTLQMLNDYSLIALALDRVKLVELKGLGRFGVHEVSLAEGKELPDKDEQVPDLNIIRQAFASADQEELMALRQAIDESLDLLTMIDSTWREKTGDSAGLGFDIARKSLQKVAGVVARFTFDSPNDPESEMTASEAPTSGISVATSSTVNSRSDVIRMLDRVCEYYSVHEPSSPVPLLLRRAQRLVEKSFMEILEDMVPDGVSQAKIVSGSGDDE